MKKLTALCLSLLVGATAFGADNPALKRATAHSARAHSGQVAAAKKIAQPNRAKKNHTPGLFETGKISKLKGTSAKKEMPQADFQTDKMYGGLCYPDYGLYQIDRSGNYTDILYDVFGQLNITCIGAKNGKLKVLSQYESSFDGILEAYYSVIDIETGTLEIHKDLLDDYDDMFVQFGAYVPEEDAFYGVANNGWIRFDCESMSAENLDPGYVDTLFDGAFSAYTYNRAEGYMAAISTKKGEIYKLDYKTGVSELLGTAKDASGDLIGGFAYDMSSGKYIHDVCSESDWESSLVAIDPKTFEVSKICDYNDMVEFQSLYVDETKLYDAEGPVEGKMVSSSFELGATTGTVTFEMPSMLGNGTSCEGEELAYKFYVNDKEYRSGSAKGGEQVVFSINESAGLGNDMAYFKLVCFYDKHEGKDGIGHLYVGKDTPVAPANVTLTTSTITWDAVPGGPHAGVHAGYVNAEAVRYNVYLNGKLLAEGLNATECATNIPANAELAMYNAEVYADYDGMVSKPGMSNKIAFGTAFEVPAEFLPTEEEVGLFDVLNANDDSTTWTWNSGMGCWEYEYSFMSQADDWLFLPPINITDAQSYYKFSLDAWKAREEYDEKFEVYIGKDVTAEAMTTQVMGSTDVEGKEAQNFEGMFSVPEPGKYYIGIHAISPRNQYRMYVNNFAVTKADIATEGPAAITDIVVTPGKEGALEATIEFKMPTKTNSGKTLDATKDVTCTLECLVDLKTVTGKPGSAQKVTVLTQQGMNEISAQTSKEGVKGMITPINVYTGIAPLRTVRNLHFEMGEDNLSGVLKWEAPTESVMEGGYIKQTGIKYYLCEAVGEAWYIADEIGTDVFEYPFSIAARNQDALQLGIICENEAGMAPFLTSTVVSAGTPWAVPANEKFTDGVADYQALIVRSPMYDGTDDSKYVEWDITDYVYGYADPWPDYALAGICNTDTYGEVTLPAFSTLGQNKVAFIPEIFVGGCKNVKVYAESWDVASEEIFDLDAVIGMDADEYQAIQINLPAKFQNKSWVRITMRPYFDADHYTFAMKGYKFRNMVNHDLSVAVSGAIKATVGDPATFTATIENIGLMATEFTGGTFKVTDAEGNVVAEKAVSANTEIAEDTSVTSETFEYTPAVDQVGDVTVSFTLAGTDDNTANNSAKMTVNVVKGKAIVVDDLRGEAVADGKVQLDWTDVKIRGGYESFEEMNPFELSGTNIGQFTQVKNDKLDVYSWDTTHNTALAKLLEKIQYKSGFNVYNSAALDEAFGKAGLWPASDGEQFLIAFCPGKQEDGTTPDADDWLISPAVKGGSTFSFDIRPLTNNYGKEKIEICYSTSDAIDVKDFKVLKTVEIGSGIEGEQTVWETISETLPENAKRFAIHYVSHDVMGICIDKVEWIPASGVLSVTMYEVYREIEGAFVKIGEATANSFVDDTANTSVINKYYVIPVLSDKSKGLKSNVAEVKAYVSGVADLLSSQAIVAGKGTIVIRGFEGEKVVVTTADGKLVATGVAKDETRVEVAAGVYIVKAGKRAAKLIVR